MTFSMITKPRGCKPLWIGMVALTLAATLISFMMLAATVTAAGTVLGDADGDGEVSINDVTCIQMTLAELTPTAFSRTAADIDGNGEIEIMDATLIQQWLAEIETSYSIGEPLETPTEPTATQSPTDEDGWGRIVYRP